ncbi:MAG TPA: energy transducer TonB [Vicinamibacterales bacterium]|nr:energy transducer TonB [Vicinamibacterales bacterium]
MPSTLFDQTFAGTKKNKRPFGTVSISILLHAIALGVIVALQISTGLAGPPIISHLRAFAVEPDLPKPPPVTATPPPATTAVTVDPHAAPLDAPSKIEPEPPALQVTASSGAPSDWMTGPTTSLSGPPAVAKPAAPEVPSRPTGPVPVGGDIRPPERLTYVPPAYPEIARIAHVEGKVIVEATIDEWGVVKNVVVRQSVPLLDKAAIDAVSKWRYAPTRLNGQPIAIVMMVTVTFTLR